MPPSLPPPHPPATTIEQLIAKWPGKQGAGERAEYQQFLTELAQALEVPTPGDAGHATPDYRFDSVPADAYSVWIAEGK